MSSGIEQNEGRKDALGEVFVIFVGEVQEKWHEATVTAGQIMLEAGVSEPSSFVLEALDRKGGSPIAEFTSGESVDLEDKNRRFFRVTPGGGGRS